MAVLLVTITQRRGRIVTMDDLGEDAAKASKDKDLPSLGRSRVAPITAVVLLLLNPVGSILHIGLLERFQVDAMYIVVPGIHPGPAGRGKGGKILTYTSAGLQRMVDVVPILIGAGALGGLITSSDLPKQIVNLIHAMGVSGSMLAPIADILMAAATVIDQLPHGNYFHVTAKSINMTLGERMKVVPFEFLVGLTMTLVAILVYLVF